RARHARIERLADAVSPGVQRAAFRARLARSVLPLHRGERSEVRRRRDVGLPLAHAAAASVAGGSMMRCSDTRSPDVHVGGRAARGPLASRAARANPAWRPGLRLLASVLLALLFAACRQDMHDQPKYQPFERNKFFADQRA